ncbi:MULTISPECIES: 1-(5-phosphoribosyl)-5-((5-phosphoribosylamino)methylideneamino)imidazole-4-carboxamide isomerase [Metallosphaera]|uniref:1-(5-phosphoribosyl)-5-[(5-phosphoribosylamino)methylideneamino] imidazole-4-carboxamide isomerase n=3 Tax=Metallosphaera TaxID=41980 RepID=A4YI32_METS5|nr:MULTISPECIES: 1-(5-phosphoribosyl)-5-((5-phosphoribosylamino)methylideneamino)imidazole-4-carboxamide isomerase [Metallosphaera]ABP96084.1 1-(5-phosphoribosyl)-5-[(5-phosphoribosylamino)methylideneamino] imidazole-4-carboxamide isomerase [Metallosphaera sedula DSM 5348]AIM28068.1 1-(5-phosphoribosyl)-5-[(5-phosphoribosylamino)methylideneamino] imidazole-4-carboxamide isomerase [Metallosphaera sedula]AKV74896.1 1-(5-phosphoribosyl)-5-[(5-phosphoribosylamino)methylideneamino] imidazole-4-carbox
MKVVPSIDISKGMAVKRVRGREGTGLVLGDPLKIAEELRNMGYTSVHLVDLDAAEGKGDNVEVIERVMKDFSEISVGGGIRDRSRLERFLSSGATKVVMSTLAFTKPDTFRRVVAGYENRVLVSVDYCERKVLIKGWNESAMSFEEAISHVNSLGVRGVIFTYVCNEGTRNGIDPEIGRYVNLVQGEKGYAGGIGSIQDLQELDKMGFHFAIVGMSLYAGVLRGVTSV